MSFRNKVFLSITATVVLAVWIVAAVVSTLVSQSFERRDDQRTATAVGQLQREIGRRGAEVARRVQAVAESDPVQRLAVNLGDASQYFAEAQTLAAGTRFIRGRDLDSSALVAVTDQPMEASRAMTAA